MTFESKINEWHVYWVPVQLMQASSNLPYIPK